MLRRLPIALIALLLVAGLVTPAAATSLSSAAASLAVKGWTNISGQFSYPGFGSLASIVQTQGGQNHIFEFNNSAAWDPVNRRHIFCGASHGLTYDARCISLDDTTNTFSTFAWPPGECSSGGGGGAACFNHAYDHHGMNPATGAYYYVRGEAGAKTVKRWRNGAWEVLTQPPAMDWNTSCCKVLKFHEGMNAIILIDPNSGVWKGVEGAGTSVTWTCIRQTGADSPQCPAESARAPLRDATQMTGEYSRVRGLLYFGVGSTVYALAGNGTITQLPSSPRSLSLLSGVTTVDPVTGNLLVFNTGGMSEFNGTSWAPVNTPVPSDATDGSGDCHATAPNSTYGVVMHMTCTGKYYLYKHTASGPVNPTLTVAKAGTGIGTVTGTGISCGSDCFEQVTSGTQITLTATPIAGTFSGWSGVAGCPGTAPCTVTVSTDTTVTATFQGAQAPTSPTTLLSTGYVTPSGSTINVPAGGDLQAALNAATPGQRIVLAAGATYTGNFTLPNKSGSTYIYVESSALSSLPEGTRVGPGQAASMPKLVSPNTQPVITGGASAHHYRFVGIEITVSPAPTSAVGMNLVQLDAGAGAAPNNIVFDRCYIHGTPNGHVRRGLLFNGATMAVVDSYISDIHEVGADSQAIAAWNGAGPFKIVNNYLEAAGENILFGGEAALINNLVPSDIEIRRNTLFKPLSWKQDDPSYAGNPWSVKNSLEFKNAQRVIVDGNVIDRNWAASQPNGAAVLLTPRNQCSSSPGCNPWAVVQDIRFTNNTVQHVGVAVSIQGTDDLQPSQQTKRVLIQNNLFDASSTWGTGDAVYMAAASTDVVVNHNTIFNTRHGVLVSSAIGYTCPCPPTILPADQHVRFEFRNNIIVPPIFGDYGVGTNSTAIAAYFPASLWTNNAFVGGTAGQFPSGNFFPANQAAVGYVNFGGGNYTLTAGSPLHNAATDGTDVGADFAAITAAQTPPDIQAPTITNLTATAVSSSQINLVGTDSDNVGVVSRTFEFCAGVGCTTFAALPGQPVQTSTFSATGLSASTAYSFRYRAQDAAGNVSSVSPTASASTQAGGGGGGSADADFAARCKGATATTSGTGGVLRCFNFDDVAQLGTINGGNNSWGQDFGVMAGGGPFPVIDTTVKASGTGSMRQPTNGTNQPREWFTAFGPNKTGQLNTGDEIYVQYRYRFDPVFLDASLWPGSDGFKQDSFSLGDHPTCNPSGPISSMCTTSCQAPTFVTQNSGNTGKVTAYMNCGGPQAFGEPFFNSGSEFFKQNAWPQGCAYTVGTANGWAEPNCFRYHPSEWMTFKKYLKMGHFNQYDNVIKVWAGREGQPLNLIYHCGPGALRVCNDARVGADGSQGWNLFMVPTICDGGGNNCHPGSEYKMGKVYLLSYQTGFSGNGAVGSVWYDELIISTQDIADPGAPAPTPTSTLTVSKQGTGTGTVTSSPSGISCGATCAASFTNGSITLTAAPTAGHTVTWSGGGCSGSGLTCNVTLSADTTVTVTFTAPAPGNTIFGLEWPGNGLIRRMLYFPNPHTNGLPIYPATYVFKVFPRKKVCPGDQTAYYTTFFWGNNGTFTWNGGAANTYYGMHPYPALGGGAPCGAGSWEISVNGIDPTTGVEVQWDRWHQQAIRVRRVNATTTEHEFYYDWDPANPPASCSAATKCLSQTVNFPTWATTNPPNPAVVIGQAPDLCGPPPGNCGQSWGGYPGWEEFDGIIRGIQIYSNYLTLPDIAAEINSPKSSTAGAASIWYLNINPRPTDVTDKKATGTPHNPQWDGSTALEWQGTDTTPTPPAAPSNLKVTVAP